MNLLDITLVLATLFCTLIAGLVFGFTTVIMPGLAALDDRQYIRSFQVIDGVIQRGQPIFGVVWLGSTVAIVVAAAIGIQQLDGIERLLVIAGALAYLVGVQAPTFIVNVPLNNAIQKVDVDGLDDAAMAAARLAFERRWVRWNTIRTIVATAVSAIMMIILLLL
ncbi:MAG: anthrone oxygenase family protein [Pseudomonadota bacterium]